MTAVSDVFDVAPNMAAPSKPAVEGRDARPRGRARVADTDGDGKIGAVVAAVTADVTGAWPWRTTPPTLQTVWDSTIATDGDVPDGSRALRLFLTGWNIAVALPATAVLYTLAWLLQHPARAIPVGGFLAAVILISIYG